MDVFFPGPQIVRGSFFRAQKAPNRQFLYFFVSKCSAIFFKKLKISVVRKLPSGISLFVAPDRGRAMFFTGGVVLAWPRTRGGSRSARQPPLHGAPHGARLCEALAGSAPRRHADAGGRTSMPYTPPREISATRTSLPLTLSVEGK